MATPFENFVNTELPKRIGTNESPITPQAGDIPVFTGVGLLTESKTAAEAGLATTGDLTGLATETFATNAANTAETAANTYTDTQLLNKADLVEGKVPASQLPSYVDDVLEYANLASFPLLGEASKLYLAIDTNLVYRWSGSTYAVTSSSLALGETSTTAYYGDKGKTAYDHSQATGNPHNLPLADGTNAGVSLNNYTSTEKSKLEAITGTNTGDETTASIKTKLGVANTSTDGYLTSTNWNTFNNKQAALADVVTANTYGSSTQYPIVTVNAKGIVTGVTLQTVAPASAPAYAAGVAYAVGELVYHQKHTWRVLVAHTGAIPFVNGNLELVGDTFQIYVNGPSSYTCPRLGVVSGSAKVDKSLFVDFSTSAGFTVDISEAPFRVVIRNTASFTKLLTVSKTAAGTVSFYDDQNNIITTTSGTTSTCDIPLAAYSHVEILNYSSVAYVNLTKQNIIGKFKLRDVSAVESIAARDDGWLFAGTATAARTITLPDADVDLGKLTNSTVAPSDITVTASPFTYQNTTAFNGDVIISGGTVSDIEFTRDNTTFYTVGFIEGVLRLSPSDRVRVTYTVAPTMTLVPR